MCIIHWVNHYVLKFQKCCTNARLAKTILAGIPNQNIAKNSHNQKTILIKRINRE